MIVGAALSGCAASPPDNPWGDLTTETDPATTSIDCGGFPMPAEVIGDSLIYERPGANALESYRVCSEANQVIAAENAAQVNELKVARAALVDAGSAQRNIAEMRQEMLQDERRHHFWQSLGYWVLIIGAVAL